MSQNPADLDDDLSARPRIPNFEEFRRAPVFNNLENIYGFDVTVKVPKVFDWVGTDAARLVVARMYQEVLVVLEESGLHSTDRLEPLNGASRAGVVYKDDEFRFEVFFDSDGDLLITREGSSFERFHTWYQRLMPSMGSLVSRLLQAVSESFDEQQSGLLTSRLRPVPVELKPLSAAYRFMFVAYNIQRPPATDVEKNVVVMSELLTRVPDIDGRLAETSAQVETGFLGRMDVAISRWAQDPSGLMAREIYRVQAPSNRRYTTLWLDFVYQGEGYEAPDGDRKRFNPDRFLSAYEIPYMDFLKARALENFVQEVTKHCRFETSAGSLP